MLDSHVLHASGRFCRGHQWSSCRNHVLFPMVFPSFHVKIIDMFIMFHPSFLIIFDHLSSFFYNCLSFFYHFIIDSYDIAIFLNWHSTPPKQPPWPRFRRKDVDWLLNLAGCKEEMVLRLTPGGLFLQKSDGDNHSYGADGDAYIYNIYIIMISDFYDFG